MAWITTEDGRRVNTEWFTDEERKKYAQIEAAQKEAEERNHTPDRVTLQQYGRDTESYKTLFPLPVNIQDTNEIMSYMFGLDKYKGMRPVKTADKQVVNIELSSLSNNQETVKKDKIDSMIRLGIEKIGKLQDKESSGLPYVIHFGNTNLIVDGHHRLTAIKALGGKTANVLYFDLEAYMKKKGKNKLCG